MDWLSSLGSLIGFGDPGAAPPTQNPFDFGTPGQTQAATPSWLDPVSEMFKRDLEASNPNTAPAAAEAGQSMGEKAQDLYFDDWGTGSDLKAGDQLKDDPYSWRRVLDNIGKTAGAVGKASASLMGSTAPGAMPTPIAAPSVKTLESVPAEFLMPLLQAAMKAGGQRR